MRNLKIYENNCKEDILSKSQLEKKHVEYHIGKNLFATSDRGWIAYQDDSVIILEHPNNQNLKLIALADGVGSSIDGDLASNHVLKRLIIWFESIKDYETYRVKENLKEMLNHVLNDLQANIYAATTLSAAIVLENKTIIANIGDSRIYTIKNNKLNQRTRDDSKVQDLLAKRIILNKEEARFHKENHILLQVIAFWPEDYNINYKIINNNYDKLLVTTDGVTDCLSTKQIEEIIKTSKDEEITSNIVKKAIESDSFLEDIIKKTPEKDYVKEIKGGQDNTTAAIYIRK